MPFNRHSYYEDTGAGRPVLFIHGWCMSSAVWEMQRETVAAQYRFLALDLRGHGHSFLPDGPAEGFSGYAEDVVSLVELLDLKGLVAVGWSMGAQALLKAYPLIKERVSALVLVGATPRFSAAPHFPHGLPPKEAEGMRLKVRRNLERALDGFHRSLFVEDELESSEAAQNMAFFLEQVPAPSALAAVAGLEALMDEELLNEAAQVTCPTLLLHGVEDRVCLPAASAWLEAAMINSRRILYNGCGHAPFLSRVEQFNHDLMQFIGELHDRH